MNIEFNGQHLSLPEQVRTFHQLLEWQQLPTTGIALICNQQLVPKSQHVDWPLNPGDQLEVLTAVVGG